METERPLSDEEKLHSGTWAVILFAAARSFIGRIHLLDLREPYFADKPPEQEGEGKPTKKKASLSVEEVLRANVITLLPSVDFFNITLRPVPIINPDTGRPNMKDGLPELGMVRDPITNSTEFLLEDVQVHLRNWIGIYFFSQMSKQDVTSYKSFINSAWQQREKFRAARSQIQAPTAEELAAVTRGRGRPHA